MAAYLDWNATAPLRPQARAAYLEALDLSWGNPASLHRWGQRARHRLDQARSRIAQALGCKAHELVLTSGGTEANALAIASALSGGGGAVASAIEHSSVLRNAEQACAGHGQELRLVGVGADGRIDAQRLLDSIDRHTRLACLQLANNEIGTVQDIATLIGVLRRDHPGLKVLVDCCQGVGKTPLVLSTLDADFASVAGHKLGAPKGVGLLYVRQGQAVQALLRGGRQQQDRRSGTEDACLADALAAAVEATLEGAAQEMERQRMLLDGLWTRLHAECPDCVWIAHQAPRLVNTMSLAHPRCRREHLVTRLDLAGFAVSPGAACMAARGDPSHVIAALGLAEELARSVIRISIGWSTSAAELEGFAAAYTREVRALAE